MTDPYGRVKGGKLSFKGESKAINKKKKKNQHIHKTVKAVVEEDQPDAVPESTENETGVGGSGSGSVGVGAGAEIYTIDAAKRMKYDELFPVEAKKFGYEPPKLKSVEDALDDRVKKKADRYCK